MPAVFVFLLIRPSFGARLLITAVLAVVVVIWLHKKPVALISSFTSPIT